MNEIDKLTRGYSNKEIQASMEYFYDLRDECRNIIEERLKTIEERIWHSTTPELLTYRLASYIIEELWICERRARERSFYANLAREIREERERKEFDKQNDICYTIIEKGKEMKHVERSKNWGK